MATKQALTTQHHLTERLQGEDCGWGWEEWEKKPAYISSLEFAMICKDQQKESKAKQRYAITM